MAGHMNERRNRRRLLPLTGLPGTGKTYIAEYLSRHHGFIHWDVEVRGRIPSVQDVAEWVRQDADVVVSWGFMPGASDHQMRYPQGLGLKMAWLGGSIDVARRHWMDREAQRETPIPEDALRAQQDRIGRMNLSSFGAVTIDPFTSDGAFKSPEQRVRMLLAMLE
jgi:hypothetical protein